MDMITYISALLAVCVLLGLFALVMRQVTQGGLRTRGLTQGLSNALPPSLRRFLPQGLRLPPLNAEEGFAVKAVRALDARRRIVAVEYGKKRYILLLSQQNELLLDTLVLPPTKQEQGQGDRQEQMPAKISKPQP